MPICIINLAIMLLYFYMKVDFEDSPDDKKTISLPEAKIRNPRELGWQCAVLVLMIFLFSFHSVHVGLVALCGAISIFALSSYKEGVLRKLQVQDDVRFFFLLFILVGGVKSSGLLQTMMDSLRFLSGGSSFIQCVLLMWGAAFSTMFLNAGPTTALFLPIFLGVDGGLPDKLIFWSLSLGVCAGSSGTLMGASAGPLALTFMERFEGMASGVARKRGF